MPKTPTNIEQLLFEDYCNMATSNATTVLYRDILYYNEWANRAGGPKGKTEQAILREFRSLSEEDLVARLVILKMLETNRTRTHWLPDAYERRIAQLKRNRRRRERRLAHGKKSK